MGSAMIEMLFLYTGSLIALVSFIFFIFKKSRKMSDFFMGLLFLNCMYLLFFNAFSAPSKQFILLHNILDMISYYSYILCPPIIFMYIYLNTMFEQKVTWKSLLVFLPSAIYYVVFTIVMFVHHEHFTQSLFFEKDPAGNFMLFKVVFDNVNFIIFCIYFVISIAYLSTLRPQKTLKHMVPFLFFTMFISSVFMIVIFQYFNLFLLSGISLILTIVIFDIVVFKYPHIDKVISVSAAKRKYKNSQIVNLDLGKLESGMKQLFEAEKIFLDEELNIRTVSSKLSVSINQLSEYINTHHEKSFNAYVNEYRVKEALSILKEEPGLKVTTLSFEVGFSTVATFYKYFKQMTGMKPLEYIRNQARD